MKESERVRLRKNFGPWALVTGASSGIGLEISKGLADAGIKLLITGRDLEALNHLALSLKGITEVKVVKADLSMEGNVNLLLQSGSELDIGLLVNNAGFGNAGEFGHTTIEQEVNLLRVNCEAVLRLSWHFCRKFEKRHTAGIIFLSSIVAFQGTAFSANYAASKAYVQSLAEALAVEKKRKGLAVLSVAPGPVNTGFGKRANLNLNNAMSASIVATAALKAIGRQTGSVPGWFSKLLTYGLRTLPRKARVRVMSKVMQGMMKKTG